MPPDEPSADARLQAAAALAAAIVQAGGTSAPEGAAALLWDVYFAAFPDGTDYAEERSRRAERAAEARAESAEWDAVLDEESLNTL